MSTVFFFFFQICGKIFVGANDLILKKKKKVIERARLFFFYGLCLFFQWKTFFFILHMQYQHFNFIFKRVTFLILPEGS